MIKTIARLALCLALTACATPSVPARPIESPAALALDPRLCAPVPAEPVLPAAADLVAPVTLAERAAVLAFILWNQAALAWGRDLADRADLARVACEDLAPQ